MESYFAKVWAMGSKWGEDCMLRIIWVSYGNKFSHTYALSMGIICDTDTVLFCRLPTLADKE